jgi:ABC-type enterochelin transport system substrate-binding protein
MAGKTSEFAAKLAELETQFKENESKATNSEQTASVCIQNDQRRENMCLIRSYPPSPNFASMWHKVGFRKLIKW